MIRICWTFALIPSDSLPASFWHLLLSVMVGSHSQLLAHLWGSLGSAIPSVVGAYRHPGEVQLGTAGAPGVTHSRVAMTA